MSRPTPLRLPIEDLARLTRRSFLHRGSLAAAGLGLGAAACKPVVEPSTAAVSGPWGTARPGGESVLLPDQVRPDGVLELFLIGGLCPWDTFYVVPEYGAPTGGGNSGTMWWTFQNTFNSVPDFYTRCGGAGPLLLDPWATDAAGAGVRLGAFLYPLRDRPDITSRMRMWVIRHDQGAHETAIPLTLCGHPQSSPRMASTPAHVQRFFEERRSAERLNPWTAVLYPGLSDLSALNGEAASAVGLHRGSARPLSLRFGAGGLSSDGLDRATVAQRRDALDAAVQGHVRRYEERFRRIDTGERVRASAIDDFVAARLALGRSDVFLDLAGAGAFQGATGQECLDSSPADYTAMEFDLAVRMLTDPTEPLRWVTLVDGGLLPATAGAAYDTHFAHVHQSSRNVVHTMKRLVASINEPGENDPRKLDLERQTVLVTTEFGRTPYAVGDGLNHWADGYVVMAIGGPFDEERSGIVGSIGESGIAGEWITPADFRAAMLLAQGIWPFNGESFAVGDVSANTLNEIEGATYLREHVLGYPRT